MGTAAIIGAIASLVSAIGGLFAGPKVARKLEERRQRKQAPKQEVCTEPAAPASKPPVPKAVK